VKTLFDEVKIYKSPAWLWRHDGDLLYRKGRRFHDEWRLYSSNASELIANWIRNSYIDEVPSEDAV
jgi:hypothetical protein